MSKVFQRLFVSALAHVGTESAFIQRAASKAARAQHTFASKTLSPTSEKAGMWLGAAAREVMLDLQAAAAYLQREPAPAEGEKSKLQQGPPSDASGRSSMSKGPTTTAASGQHRPLR